MSYLVWRPSKQVHVTLGYLLGARGVAYCVAKLYDEWRNPLVPQTVQTRHLRYTVEMTWPMPRGTDPIFKSADPAQAKAWADKRLLELYAAIDFAQGNRGA